MTELSGFSPVSKLGPDVGPQSFRVPSSKADAISAAAQILGALWHAVDADLAPNVTVEILKPTGGQTYCRITPIQFDGFPVIPSAALASTKTTADPGGWVAVDGSALVGMTNDAYAAQFTQNIPIEWAATSAAPAAAAAAGLSATLVFPQPVSANRPFTYAVAQTDVTASASGAATFDAPEVAPDGSVTVKVNGLTEGHQYTFTVTVNTQYQGVTATSAATAAITAASAPGG